MDVTQFCFGEILGIIGMVINVNCRLACIKVAKIVKLRKGARLNENVVNVVFDFKLKIRA
jgi:hypothetical protein